MANKITKRLIQSYLADSAFSPSDKSPFSAVVAMDNPEYAELKATELILEGREAFKLGSLRTYHEKIQQAVSLLVLARAQRGLVQIEKEKRA